MTSADVFSSVVILLGVAVLAVKALTLTAYRRIDRDTTQVIVTQQQRVIEALSKPQWGATRREQEFQIWTPQEREALGINDNERFIEETRKALFETEWQNATTSRLHGVGEQYTHTLKRKEVHHEAK